ncbi:hypothetical protein GCM10020216_025230 [Nonomuraea helvata]
MRAQALQSVYEQRVLGLEVVLHQAERDMGLGGYGAHGHLLEALGLGDAQHRLGDLLSTLLMINLQRHVA